MKTEDEIWVGMNPPNHFIGDSINIVASCLNKDQVMHTILLDHDELPTDYINYPPFEPSEQLKNLTTIYIPHQNGYYCTKILKR